jgi:hypothetical protein
MFGSWLDPGIIRAWPTPGSSLSALSWDPGGAAAAVFLGFVHDLQHWLWTDLPDALGESGPRGTSWSACRSRGAVVWLARTLLPGDGGHTPLHGIDPAPAPLSHAPGIVLPRPARLGFGLVLGPEAPVVALGSIVALALTSFARLADKETRCWPRPARSPRSRRCSAADRRGRDDDRAAAPTLGAMLVPALLPGFVAAAIGYVIFVGFGNWGGLETAGLAVPNLPLYDGPGSSTSSSPS